MMRRIGFICLLLLIAGIMTAQPSSYWQQKVDHTIQVTLDDSLHMLFGDEEVTYHNQSPDTLEYLIFHLWPNAYKNKNTALARQLVRMGNTKMLFAAPEDLGYIDGLAFELDGLPCVWEYDPKHIDVCTLYLERPLPPGEKVVVSTPFRVKLPSGNISRLGHIDQSYQVTQWFPKPAVYDHEGWHPMPYLTQGEFYSEYGSYDVTITLPANYTVGATGDLQTSSEIERLNRLAEETRGWIKEVDEQDTWVEVRKDNEFPESHLEMKTLRYTQSNVHDFAWFADKRFHVLKGKVQLPSSKDSVTVWTMFTDREADLWAESIEYMQDAIYYYSLWNGDYPYQQATAVDGTISAGGGMEYPNVTVIGTSGSAYSLETVIVHEVGHNWFYGILGSNERRFAWMDEGLNSYNEQRYLSTKYPGSKMFVGNNELPGVAKFIGLDRYESRDQHYLSYLISARSNMDQPLDLSSEKYSMINYGTIVYSKSAVWFDYLRHYLGDAVMDSAMHTYYRAYKFKHPYPEDFRRVMTESTNKDLNWLFEKGIDSTAKIDYKITSVKLQDDHTFVTLKNKGSVNSPIPVAWYKDGKLVEKRWIEGFHGKNKVDFTGTSDHVVIDPDRVVPELRRDNNHADTKGLFKKQEPLQFKLLGQLEDPTRTEVYWTPIISATVPGGFTPGIAFYNSILPVKKWNWVVAPMLSTKSMSLSGVGELYYSITPEVSMFQTIDVGVKARSFTADNVFRYDPVLHLSYYRFEPYVRFDLRPNRPSGMWNDEFTLSSVILFEDQLEAAPNEVGIRSIGTRSSVFTRLRYDGVWDHPAYRTVFTVKGELYEDFLRTSIEVINHIELDKFVRIRNRLFFGSFLSNNTDEPRFNYRMEGQRPWNDYAYDALFLDRSSASDLLSRQLTETHGGFKVPTAVGSSNLGLAAYNMELFILKFPIGLYADVGYAFQGEFLTDMGLCISGKRHIFGLYLPLVYSDNIQSEITANGRTVLDLIRFQLQLDIVNPFDLRKRLQL